MRSAARAGSRWFDVVRVVLGLLLLTAAGLKLYGLNVTALPRVGWFSTPQVQVLAAEWELILGIWLLSGAYRIGAWLAALGTFTTFAIVSGYFGWIGVASCGCFGVIRTSPWTAFAVDAAAIALLVFSRSRLPGGTTLGPTSPNDSAAAAPGPARQAGPTLIAALAILLVLTAAGSCYYGSPAAALAHLRGESLTVEPSYVDFGSGGPDDIIERSITVYNWSDRPVRLVGAQADCPVGFLDSFPTTLEPNGHAQIVARLKVPTASAGTLSKRLFIWTDLAGARILRVDAAVFVQP